MNKQVLITGASKGIGFETAKLLSDAGCTVIAAARTKEKLEALQQHNSKLIIPVLADITTRGASDTIRNHLPRPGKLDGIIHNAGVLINKPFAKMTDDDWHRQLSVNLMAPVRLTRDLLPDLNQNAHILNISSMGGFQGSDKFPGLSGYSASKGALAVLTECLAAELSNNNISINCLCLGAVQTEMLNQAFPGFKAPVKPQDMGRYVADFFLTGHTFYNGKILPVALNNPS